MFKTLKPYEEYIALFTLFLIWFVLLILSGAYKSGFHLMDDHGIIELSNLLDQNSYWHTLKEVINTDFKIRFRPFYYVNHLFLIKILGPNLTYWGLHHFFIACLTSFFLFKTARFFKLDVVISLLFVVIVLIGEQTEIFYRTSPAERSGLFFLSVGIYIWLIGKNQILKSLGLVFIVLATLSKESFILIIPFLVVGLYLLDSDTISVANIISFFKKRKIIILFLVVIMISEIAITYALLSRSTNYLKVVESKKSIFYYLFLVEEKLNFKGIITQVGLVLTDIKGLRYLGIFTLIILLMTCSHLFTKKSFKDVQKVGLFLALVFLGLYLPQYMLYLKTSFSLRYIIPTTLFYGIIISACYFISKDFYVRSLQIILLCFLSSYLFLQTLTEIVVYKKEGEGMTKLLKFVQEKKINSVVVLTDLAYDYESSGSVIEYLKNDNKNIKVNYIEVDKDKKESIPELVTQWKEKYKSQIDKMENIENYEYVIIFEEGDGAESITELKNHKLYDFNHVLLLKKED